MGRFTAPDGLVAHAILCLALAMWAGHRGSASQGGQTGGDVFASSSAGRQCGYPGLRYDMQKVIDAARQYPNPRIHIVTLAEKRQLEQAIAAYNRGRRTTRAGMAPCFNCSREFEACIVYEHGGDEFASTYRPGGGGDDFGSTGGGPPPSGGGGGGGGGGVPPPRRNEGPGRRGPRPPARPETPAEGASCRDQVTLTAFDFMTHEGLSFAPAHSGRPDALDVSTGGGAEQAMRMRARATVRPGRIDPDRIQIRYVQNVLSFGGTLTRDTAPGIRIALRDPSCRVPLLDLPRPEPRMPPPLPPFYRPVTQTGAMREVMLWDSPNLENVLARFPDGSRATRLDVFWAFTTYVGCTITGDPRLPPSNFETIATVDWTAWITGTIARDPADNRWVVTADPLDGAGALQDAVVLSSVAPRAMALPTFNGCMGGPQAPGGQ